MRPRRHAHGTVQEFAAFRWCDDAIVAPPFESGGAARSRQIGRRQRKAAAATAICLQEVEFEKAASAGAVRRLHADALGAGIIACNLILDAPPSATLPGVVEQGRCSGTTGAVEPVEARLGWRVAWTGEHNGTTEVLVGIEKGGAQAGGQGWPSCRPLLHTSTRARGQACTTARCDLAAARACSRRRPQPPCHRRPGHERRTQSWVGSSALWFH